MPKYRRKPVVLEAEPFKKGMEDGYAVYSAMGFKGFYSKDKAKTLLGVLLVPAIKTLDGWQEVGRDYYIITGIKGERYACRSEIFNELYEKVDNE